MKKTLKWLPIIIIEIYLLFTLFLYKWGPWDFVSVNPLKTYILLLLYQLALFLGYFVAMKCVFPTKAKSYQNRDSIIKIVHIISIINIFFSIIVLTRELGLNTVSFVSIFERFMLGLKNPASVYNMKFGYQVDSIFLGKLGTILIVLWSPISYSIIPINCILYRKLQKRWKIVSIINIFLSIVLYVSIGTNKGIFDIAIFIFSAYFIGLFQKINQTEKKVNFIKLVCLFVLIIVPALLFFNKAIGSRGVGSAWKIPGYTLGGQVYINSASFVFKYLPEGLAGFVVLLSGYLCQGYYGFSMATAANWTPMFGLGNSMFLVEQLNLNELTYQYKVQTLFGWDSRVQWHSIYSWLANDFGIYGVIAILFIIGFLFAVFYKESILFDNPLSELLLSFFMIIIFFIPANNQMLQGLESLFSFWFAILMWFFCKNYRFIIRLKR